MPNPKSKAASAQLGRDSQPKYLGIKLFEGETAKVGQVLVRQRGAKILPGKNVKKGGDDTLYAMKSGLVYFTTKTKKRFDGSRRTAKIIEIK